MDPVRVDLEDPDFSWIPEYWVAESPEAAAAAAWRSGRVMGPVEEVYGPFIAGGSSVSLYRVGYALEAA